MWGNRNKRNVILEKFVNKSFEEGSVNIREGVSQQVAEVKTQGVLKTPRGQSFKKGMSEVMYQFYSEVLLEKKRSL